MTPSATRLRILHVVSSYIPAWRYGGPIRSVHGLCRALVGRGHDVRVLTTNIDGERDSDVPLGSPVDVDGVRVYYYRSPGLRRLAWAPGLSAAARVHVPRSHVVHTHGLFQHPQSMAARVAYRAGVPYVVAPRGMLAPRLVRGKNYLLKTLWVRLFDRRNLERASALHLTSSVERSAVDEFGFSLPRAFVVPNGLDLAEKASFESSSSTVNPPAGNTPMLLFIGRLSWEKGLDRLIRALPLVPRAHLVLAGNDETGFGKTLTTLAETVGVADRVTIREPVYDEHKVRLLSQASLFVLPSYSENFGNVVLEAMASGCPVVVTSEVGARDVVRQSGCGIVVPGDVESLGHEMASFLRDETKRMRCSAAGRHAVHTGYSWEAIAERMERLYLHVRLPDQSVARSA